MGSLLDPIAEGLAFVLAGAHDALTGLGLGADSGLTWVLSIGALVVLVRLLMLPLVAHGVKLAHSSARARPHLTALQERYKDHLSAGTADPEVLRELLKERRAISQEHGVSSMGCLPLLIQLPVWFALYQLLARVSGGQSVGAMGNDLVSSLGRATLGGVHLADRWNSGGGAQNILVVIGLAALAALFSYATTKWFSLPNTTTEGMPEVMQQTYLLMPMVSALSMFAGAFVVPVGLLVYWVISGLWTMLQTWAVTAWWPTPGTPAHFSRHGHDGLARPDTPASEQVVAGEIADADAPARKD